MSSLEKRLLGKNAFITGAGSGIGRAIALRYAREGANVAINDLKVESAEQTSREVEALGVKSLVLPADVSDSEQVQALVERYFTEWSKLDVLVNNAGIGSTMETVSLMKEATWDRTMNINLRSVFLVSKYFAKQMVKAKVPDDQLRGKIINISSVRGKYGRAHFGAYSASKFGVVSLTQTLALELGKNRITVNALCPGLTLTPIYGNISAENLAKNNAHIALAFKPVGMPEDVAGAAFFLASSDSDWITGQSLLVCGGQHFI
ncbi:MAG: 3-ketoacyl-ACP reductase [Promethearchaeota archaeon CR_4]|nr:MAG: 3-ketoacyl-ACP reductase [Candidatus Lokiarchaeota archaeon CR_4]